MHKTSRLSNVHAKDLVLIKKKFLTHGKNSVIMNLFSIENVYICSQKLLSVSLSEYSVIKREF